MEKVADICFRISALLDTLEGITEHYSNMEEVDIKLLLYVNQMLINKIREVNDELVPLGL